MEKKWLCFYGDDFTGSTDTMEALAIHGARTVLFLQVPDRELLESRFQDVPCIGVAGLGRTMNPTQMEEELKPILQQLQSLEPYILHYKTCSTFDSSSEIGNIGYVMDMNQRVEERGPIPILVGAPPLRRYTVFGNHFATLGEQTYRLDRHPVMSKHPVTPMNESDLRLHLKTQSDAEIDLIDILHLEKDVPHITNLIIEKAKKQPQAILFDILTQEHLEKIGEVLWNEVRSGVVSSFFIGSSGISYALAAHWRKMGMIESPTFSPRELNTQPTLVVSASCSQVTASQLQWALNHGFVGLQLSPWEFMNPEYIQNILHAACSYIEQGESVILYTALGPEDPSIYKTKEFIQQMELTSYNPGQFIGEKLGLLTRDIILNTLLNRVVIAGGDTSGFVTRELDIMALEVMVPIAPGVPLCKCYSQNQRFDGLEIALKSGQLGQVDYFERVRTGDASHYFV